MALPRSEELASEDPSSLRLPAAARRRQLLAVAVEAFSAGGYHGTSMDDVAGAAGVTKPVLYQHFGSKRELYVQLLDDVGAQLLDAIAKATVDADHPRTQVEQGFAAYFGFVAEHEAAFGLLFGGGSKRDEDFADRVRSIERSIAALIGSLIVAADIDDRHRAVLAHGIVGLAESACRHWLLERKGDPGAATADELAAQMAELAWAGLRGVGGRPTAG